MALTHDDVKNLLSIIDSAEHLEEIELSWGDFQIHLWRNAGASRAAPASMPAPAPRPLSTPLPAQGAPASMGEQPRGAASPTPLDLETGEIVIRAPMLGTFYRAASPGDPPFVEVGQRVAAGDTVCLIEVMKLFNTIRAGVDGTVTRILHDNASLVEFDEPLLVIRSAGAA
jgi:acetyl-CoA carboxylase biotin carboxyl carrier protein